MNGVSAAPEWIADTVSTGCCVVGGGPAGLFLSLLLARKGVPVTLLESHHDFDRDFRGDTIHPSTMEALDQLGLADRLLEIPHGRLEKMEIRSGGTVTTVARFNRLKTCFPFVTIMPQVKFLDFLAREASAYPSFRMVMGANVQRLVSGGGAVRGVRHMGPDGAWHEVLAPLTVGADGRFSKVRSLSGAIPETTSPPMDVLWFRIPRREGDPRDQISFYIGGGNLVFLFDRGEEWQVGYAITKGSFGEAKAAGLGFIRDQMNRLVPWLSDHAQSLKDWKQVVVLSVESSRVPAWHQPGLLLIGDAAHVMSPVGGVGINFAIQDAIEAANLLAKPLKAGTVSEAELAAVQRNREPSVRRIQRFQAFVQNRVVKAALDKDKPFTLPWIARVILSIPWVRDFPARMIAFGPNQARIRD